MSEAHLKSYQYYADLYDRGTVEICRRTEKSFNKEIEVPEDKEANKEELARINKIAKEMYLHAETGERYLNREKTIQEWMERDRAKDELYESAQAPEDIRCLTCRNRMKPTWKDLWWSDGKQDRVLFMYDCPNQCMPRRAFFDNGEEWRTKPKPCTNCRKPVITTSEERPNGYVTIDTCTSCGNVETDEHEWLRKEEDVYDENFAKDRDRFCLTAEDGKKFQEEKWNLEQLGKLTEKWKEEDERRKKKLEENPKGFHLEGRFSCIICGNGTPEGDNWYDEHGIKCLVCQKAIDEGEIPATVASDKESWYSRYDLESRFSLKGPTLRKWIKEGIIKPRIISFYGKGSHYELFLIEDNKDFLPPKKMTESRRGHEIVEGIKKEGFYPWYRFVDPFVYLKDYGIIKHMRPVSKEELKEREETKKKKEEERHARRERLKEVRAKKGIKRKPRKKT